MFEMLFPVFMYFIDSILSVIIHGVFRKVDIGKK